MILSDQSRNTYLHMLSSRMRWARREQERLGKGMTDTIQEAADEEVRSMIREIARMCRFDSEQVNEITSVAWTASKENE